MPNKIHKMYENLCRLYARHRSIRTVSEILKIKSWMVKRYLIELRSIGVDIAFNITERIAGYRRNIIKAEEIDVDRLNVVIKVTRALVDTKFRIGIIKKRAKVLHRLAVLV